MSSPLDQPAIFPTILASSVHDIKNSLSIVQELIRELAEKDKQAENQQFIQLQFEANRMNNNLVQLLELFKIDTDKFCLTIDEHSLEDILQEVAAQQAPLLTLNNIKLSISCTEDLYCYCDFNHICNALSSILNNAQRYTHSEIFLSAYQEKMHFVFCLEDDGKGYPEQILSANTRKIQQCSGNTGLGLHFVSTIANLHQTKKERGFVKLDNNSTLGGARFRLFLP